MTNNEHRECGQQSLRDHIITKTHEARQAYGPQFDYPTILELLKDSRFVRYPVRLEFGHEALQPGEFAYMQQVAEHPKDGFVLSIHPFFQDRKDTLPLLIAYHLVLVNYGDIASHEEAELFGANLLGMDVEEYYRQLCQWADRIPPAKPQ